MNAELHADAHRHPAYHPHPVSDQRLAALNWTVMVLLIVMSLGPLSAYAILGG